MQIKNTILFVFALALFALSFKPAYGQGGYQYSSYDECVAQADKVYCDANTSLYPSTPSASGGEIPSGRNNNNGVSSPSPSGNGQCITDDLCNGKFCRVNGVCVPTPESQQGVGGLIGAKTIFEVVTLVLRWLLTLAGVIATVFIIIGGYQYITAAGNEEQSEKGKKTLVNAIIGIVAVVLSMAIVTIITNTLGSTEPLGYKSSEIFKG